MNSSVQFYLGNDKDKSPSPPPPNSNYTTTLHTSCVYWLYALDYAPNDIKIAAATVVPDTINAVVVDNNATHHIYCCNYALLGLIIGVGGPTSPNVRCFWCGKL